MSIRHRLAACAAIAVALAVGLLSTSAAHADTVPIWVIGQVDVAPGTPASACTVVANRYGEYDELASCHADGTFVVGASAADFWGFMMFRIDVPGHGSRHVVGLITAVRDGRVLLQGVSSRMVDLGTIVVGGPRGAISGKLTLPTNDDYDAAVVGIPELGLFVQPGPGGYYLLPGVVAGTRSVSLYLPGRARLTRAATVTAGDLTTNVNFTIRPGLDVTPLPPR